LAADSRQEPSPFDQFIAHWRRERLAEVQRADLALHLDSLVRELTQEALAQGHRVALASACRPYRHMREYVAALYDISETQHFKD
jgi:hypothetical protein